MSDTTDAHKRPEDDHGVVIGDDVWVGTRAIVLHGVTIGREAIVGAGALVDEECATLRHRGVPARVLNWRWSIDQIIGHEEKLYPPKHRRRVEQFQAWRSGQ